VGILVAPRKYTLRTKLSFVFSFVLATISLFIYLYFPAGFAEKQYQNLFGRTQIIAELTSFTIAPALFFDDTTAANNALAGARRNTDIAYLVLLNGAGHVFTAHNLDEANRDEYRTRKVTLEAASSKGILLTITPVIHKTHTIGHLYLAVSLVKLREESRETRAMILAISLLVFVVGVILIYSLTTIVTLPLTRMVDTVRQITNGDLSVRASAASTVEVGELAKAFNEMVANLTAAQRELKDINKNLEQRVKDRTERLALSEDALRQTGDQLRALSAHLQTIREEERAYISREIHDQLGQMLTAMNIDLAVIERQLLKACTPATVVTVVEKIRYLSGMVESTIQRMRRLALELRPDILDNLGLDEALEWQVKEFQARTSIRCELSKPPKPIPIDEPRAIALFRMFQESLTNIVRHAHASKVEIRLKELNGSVILEIRDDGKGIRQVDLQGVRSLGIIGMRERAAHFGGHVRFSGVPDQGTTVTIELPLA
jgi:signal transduction histidine kinase